MKSGFEITRRDGSDISFEESKRNKSAQVIITNN